MPSSRFGQYRLTRVPSSDLVVALVRSPADRAYEGDRFRIALRDGPESVAIASVQFLSQGFAVHLGYFEPRHGLLGRYSVCFDDCDKGHVDLEEFGKTTTKKIKYSHPRDGNVHFSQDTQVFTTIRNESANLTLHCGHMFSIMARGLDSFGPGQRPSRDRSLQTLEFWLPTSGQTVAKVAGFWYPERSLKVEQYAPEYSFGPGITHFRDPDGSLRDGYIVRPPRRSTWAGYCICLVGSTIPVLTEDSDPFCLFIGGFNTGAYQSGVAADPSSFLAAQYSDRSSTFDEMGSRLGSIDFR
jgi:hypothetical protein